MRLRIGVALSTAVLIVCLVNKTSSSSETTCFTRQLTQSKTPVEIEPVFNISCANNGTITILWNVKSALYLYIQIEYQCYNGSYNESQNDVYIDWAIESFEGMRRIDDLVGYTCTVAGCGMKSSRLPKIYKFRPESCLLNLTGGTPPTKNMLLPSKSEHDDTTSISTALSSMHSSSVSLSSFSSISLSSTIAIVSATSQGSTNSSPPPLSKTSQVNLDSTATIIIALVALVVSITIGSIVVFVTCACTFGKAWIRNQSMYVVQVTILKKCSHKLYCHKHKCEADNVDTVIADLDQADVFQKIELNKFTSMDSIVTTLGVIHPFSDADILPMNESPQLRAKFPNRIVSPDPDPSLSKSKEDTISESQSDVSQIICEKPLPTPAYESPNKSVMTTEYITMDFSKPEEDTSIYRPDNHEPSYNDSGVYDFKGSSDYIQLSDQAASPTVTSQLYIEYDDSSFGYICSENIII